MNIDLKERLASEGISYNRLLNAVKIKLLREWSHTFPELRASTRHAEECERIPLQTLNLQVVECVSISSFWTPTVQ